MCHFTHLPISISFEVRQNNVNIYSVTLIWIGREQTHCEIHADTLLYFMSSYFMKHKRLYFPCNIICANANNSPCILSSKKIITVFKREMFMLTL